ncbi:MAG: alpha-E domain-containing protein [Candidatus Phaeomarinobacter sp.]
MTALLSRHAENIYWMARYIERAENLARLLDVNETFSRNALGEQNWAAVIEIFSDEELFKELRGSPTTDNVIQFYTLDTDNPNSIVSQLKSVRENARALRPLISTEMWTHINTFHNQISRKRRTDVTEEKLSTFCAQVKEGCQTHTGITEGTFVRDEAWLVYEAGRALERADQTTRLLDVKYHLLLPSVEDVGSRLDVSQWNALLRSAAGYHAFRRFHPREMSPQLVASFMLFDDRFARSVRACLDRLLDVLDTLENVYKVTPSKGARRGLRALLATLKNGTVDPVFERGLHEFLDDIQDELISVSDEFALSFFADVA